MSECVCVFFSSSSFLSSFQFVWRFFLCYLVFAYYLLHTKYIFEMGKHKITMFLFILAITHICSLSRPSRMCFFFSSLCHPLITCRLSSTSQIYTKRWLNISTKPNRWNRANEYIYTHNNTAFRVSAPVFYDVDHRSRYIYKYMKLLQLSNFMQICWFLVSYLIKYNR